jgi:hypothetical protein
MTRASVTVRMTEEMAMSFRYTVLGDKEEGR